MPNPTLDQIRDNYSVLDADDFVIPENVRLISHESIGIPEIKVERIAPNGWTNLFRWFQPFFLFFFSLQLLRAADKNTIIIINGAGTLWMYIAYVNKYFFRGQRTLFLWFTYFEYILGEEKRLKFFPFIKMTVKRKEAIAIGALKEYQLVILWSKKQVDTHAKHYNLPKEKFLFIPYKSNHSKRPPYEISIDNFIFAGGNGKRDYKCLVEAVRGTDIPVIISATNPKVRAQIDFLPNVIVLGAPEPAFGQLQAASRFCVVPMIYSGLKGGGEANFCNAMWHKKPVIAACSIAAEDYIIEGETGFVVPSGDSEALRKRILELWNDPERVRQMGEKGHEHVARNFTHEHLIKRILRTALVLGESKH